MANVRTLSPLSPEERRELDASIAVRFRAARHALGWTQLAAAQWLTVSRQSVEDWERGATRVPAWAIAAIERAAGERRGATVKEAA